MPDENPPYAARLNSFRVGADRYWPGKDRVTARDLLARAATAEGLTAADLNFPDHFVDDSPADMASCLQAEGIALNGLATRYYSDPRFAGGALMNPDPRVRQAAVELTLRGLDALAEMGGDLMTLWPGQDGFDYSFQADYSRMWNDMLESMSVIADHDPSIQIALEYKPDEPRARSLLPDAGTSLLLLGELNRANTGITLDFGHVLYADETPAYTVSLVNRFSRLLGIQMNDGYGKRDDGLMVGSVHPVQTVELLVALLECDYSRAIYFDTFPDVSGLDPVVETETNVAIMESLWQVARELRDDAELARAMAVHDAAVTQRIVARALYRRG